jgi:hypothetical protein
MWAQVYDSKLLYAASPTTSADGSAVDFDSSPSISKRNIKAVLAGWGVAGTAPSTVTVKLQESDTTTAGDFADITGAVFTAVNGTAGTGFEEIHYKQTKRYVRAVVTLSANVTGANIAVGAFPLKREAA